jgi:hypothetical protein
MLVERATGYELGEAFSKASLIFGRLQRRVDAIEKARTVARTELDRLIAARPPAPEPQETSPQPQEMKEETQQLASFLNSPSVAPETGAVPAFSRLE